MKRVDFRYMLLPGTCLAVVGCGQEQKAEIRHPNVILIVTDDVGYGDIGCYGTSSVPTPNVDRLASEGVRFTDAYAVASTSTPSRYSMLTGAYAWRRSDTGVARGDAGMIIRPEQPTVADLFAQNGYQTAAIGKWHLGIGEETGKQDWNKEIHPNLSDLGFGYSYIMAATADRVPCVYIENGGVVGYDPEHPISVSYSENFEGEPTGADHPELLIMHPSHGHDQSIVSGISRIGYMKGGGSALWKDEHIGDSITYHALKYVEEMKDQPFFLYLCTNDIHVPRYPNERFRGKSGLGLRGDVIMQMDDTIGQLLAKLDELGIRDETMIIFTSDNGSVLDDGYQDQAVELNGNHQATGGLKGGKYSLYEGGTRVPFIVSWPSKVESGSTSSALVSLVDLMATMAQLLGSKDEAFKVDTDSQPWLDTWMGKTSEGRQWVIEQGLRQLTSIRRGNWKYIPAVENAYPVAWQTGNDTGQREEDQLYDLSQDPFEQNNLYGTKVEIANELKQLMDSVRWSK